MKRQRINDYAEGTGLRSQILLRGDRSWPEEAEINYEAVGHGLRGQELMMRQWGLA